VHPEHQRRGAGALLTSWGTDVAEKAGVPVYLESSPGALPLYESLGFERLKETVVHRPEVTGEESDVEIPLMVKMPASAQGMSYAEWAASGYPSTQGQMVRQ
jgi:predicted N-acetyltransferase YhbS